MTPEPTVYAVDDDVVARIMLEQVFKAADLNVETYASAEEFLDTYNIDNCGCLLLDIMMPGMDGLELQEALAERGNETPVIFLSGADDVKTAIQAFKAGALDFIEKPIDPKQVLSSVRRAMALDLRSRYERMRNAQVEQRIASLTPREREVMRWVVAGKTNKMIARILKISDRTVEVHRKKVIDKMQADSVADLVQMVLKVENQGSNVRKNT